MGDAQRLRQLLLILLDNAVRYSSDGGQVRLRLLPPEATYPQCGVEVADDGIGIAAHELPQVFERHFRGDAARRQRPDGSGLGLAIAQALARAHGGRVELSSTPGQGTVARLLLPAADAAPGSALTTASGA
jgi:two-component system OmpR family sensor kinase